jgi:hypothetical protein
MFVKQKFNFLVQKTLKKNIGSNKIEKLMF